MVSRVFAPPALGKVRLAALEDATFILRLINESMANNFRIDHILDVIHLIEDCVLSIVQLDANGVIVGFLAAKDNPLIPALHPRAWEEYIWTKYKTVELNSRNTLFIHLLCWEPVGVPGDSLPVLCIADRSEVCPRLRIRRAVEEDNDDLVPIIERHSKRLQEIYGEFYISELISKHPESERVLLVCEHKELAVGVMILNTQINFEGLEESFELSPFRGCDI
ncbi:uncharacterized protein [Choristoneura fumiferana]|uniref:uncharacterized protein n=1 Tax=Choristoneura fumiferana TaxID=7141 RepID=UPI003D15BBAD